MEHNELFQKFMYGSPEFKSSVNRHMIKCGECFPLAYKNFLIPWEDFFEDLLVIFREGDESDLSRDWVN